MAAVDITGLTHAAVEYNPTLAKLPFLTLEDELGTKGKINIIETAKKSIITEVLRKGGTTKPYSAGTVDEESNVIKPVEHVLELEKAYCNIEDNINNYEDVVLASMSAEQVDNQTKKHPLENHILEAQVLTLAEDIIDAFFHMQRDTTNKTPLGISNGIFKILTDHVTAGDISVANGNYAVSGDLTAPANANDTVAIDRLVIWIRKANPILLKNAVLYIAPDALQNVMDALENKLANKPVNGYDAVLSYLRSKCKAPNLEIISEAFFGSGYKLILTVANNFDLGFNSMSDKQFVQVRSYKQDPNYVQFWSQFEIGARVRSIHEKKFFMNEATNTSNDMSGDYVS